MLKSNLVIGTHFLQCKLRRTPVLFYVLDVYDIVTVQHQVVYITFVMLQCYLYLKSKLDLQKAMIVIVQKELVNHVYLIHNV